ncbi:Mov34/MPN/PAD-1 family protein [Sphingomonas sp. DT-204]|uniref:Mov34/MPN/PAD-1 family protein n=1 Tax=Sphingomonas sp. DT-204 TaxID=3396166 RepID=UPI003F19A111
MRCEISRSVLDDIHAEAEAFPFQETCGLLFGTPARITTHLRCRNVAPDPRKAFEIDPTQLIAAYKGARQGGPSIVGCYHSHPLGAPEPSLQDAAAAEPNGWIWLIVAGRGTGCWRAVPEGPRVGRFEAVPYSVVPDH